MDETLAIFKVIGEEYINGDLEIENFYMRRDELVKEHGSPQDGIKVQSAPPSRPPKRQQQAEPVQKITPTKKAKKGKPPSTTSPNTSSTPQTHRIMSKAHSGVHDFIARKMDSPF